MVNMNEEHLGMKWGKKTGKKMVRKGEWGMRGDVKRGNSEYRNGKNKKS